MVNFGVGVVGGSGCRRYGQRAFGLRYYVLEFHVLTALVDERTYPLTYPLTLKRERHDDPRGAVETPAVLVKAMLLNRATSGASQRCN